MKNLLLIIFLITCFGLFAQKQNKDTLFIKYDNSLLSREFNPIDKYHYYRIKGTGNNGFVFLIQEEILSDLKPKKIICLKKILKKDEFYFKSPLINQKKIGKLNDWKLEKYFSEYFIFLVRNNDFIKVRVEYQIE